SGAGAAFDVWSWLQSVPWWGWGVAAVVLWIIWGLWYATFFERHYERVNRAVDWVTWPGELPTEMKRLIRRYGADRFVAMAQVVQKTGGSAESVFRDGLPAVKELVDAYGVEPFVAIARASGGNVLSVFHDGLPMFRD